MTKETRISKSETARHDLLTFHSIFGFRYSFDMRHSDFGIIQSRLRSAAMRLAEESLEKRHSVAVEPSVPLTLPAWRGDNHRQAYVSDISETSPPEFVFCG
jgi:hypothetical protein